MNPPPGTGPTSDPPAAVPADRQVRDAQSPEPSTASLPPARRPGPTTGLGRFVTASLAGLIGVLGVTIATSIVSLLRSEERARELASPDLYFADGWLGGVGVAFLGMLLLCVVSWMTWQYRAHANLAALGPAVFRPRAIWWWVVPVASLFMPFLAVRELAGTADRPLLRRSWWAAFVLFSNLSGLSAGLVTWAGWDPIWLEWLSILTSLTGITAAGLSMAVVAMVDANVDGRRARMGYTGGWRPWPPGVKWVWGLAAAALASAGGLLMGIVLPQLSAAVARATTTASQFAIGACFNEEAGGFAEVACDTPHLGEAYALLEHPDVAFYPGEDEIEEWAEPLCYARFEGYTGVAYESSNLDFGFLYPTSASWAGGDREVVCYLFDPEGDLDTPIRTGGGSA